MKKVVLTAQEMRLINAVFDVAHYLSWQSDVGDKKANDIINDWCDFKKHPTHQGIFAEAIQLRYKIGKKRSKQS